MSAAFFLSPSASASVTWEPFQVKTKKYIF